MARTLALLAAGLLLAVGAAVVAPAATAACDVVVVDHRAPWVEVHPECMPKVDPACLDGLKPNLDQCLQP